MSASPAKRVMGGSAYVEVWVPKQIRHPYPIIYIHGAGQTATDWQQTPDGRPGWAYYFAKQGYVQYMVDSPTRGRSPYVPGHDGNLTIRTAANLEATFTASAKKGDFPRAHLHTQFPGSGLMGDPIFDAFAKTQVQFLGGGGPKSQDDLTAAALIALLDTIKTPVIILSHSQGGPRRLADRRRPPQSSEGHRNRRTRRPAHQRRRHREARLQQRRRRIELGRHLQPHPLRSSH